eukprot:TRINITY_DN1945_c0_g1_i1.p1 TRINITY_DN1945_c0_g1~~TRINITY_DN1945_c0_g1_i1.p1  ORF type:complete len:472 (+),score=173.98 TRINITY_DN1945_c0_g1_i1:41-1417(+)
MAEVEEVHASAQSAESLLRQLRAKESAVTDLTEQIADVERRGKLLEKQLEQRNAELKMVENERRVLDELQTVNQMAIRKLDNERDAKYLLPEESLDTIVRLESTIKLEKQRQENNLKEKKTLDLQSAKKEKELTKLVNELELIKRETGWTRGATTTAAAKQAKDPRGNEGKISELQMLVQKLEEESKTNRQIQRKKTQLIESLAKELDSKQQLEEDLYQAQNAIKVKDREIRDLMEELKTVKRLHAKQDKVIGSLEAEKESTTYKQLEGDKRFLQAEIAKHVEARRQQERAIKAQQQRIDQLQARLDNLVLTLRELGVDHHLQDAITGAVVPRELPAEVDLADTSVFLPGASETVDLEVFELLQRNSESLRNQLALKDVIIGEKEANVEALEKKLELLSQAKRTDARSITAERKELAFQIDDLKRALDIQQDTYRKQADKLKQENARLKKRVQPEASV